MLLDNLFSKKQVTNQLTEWKFSAVQRDTFYHHQGYEHVNLYKKKRLYNNGRSIRDKQDTIYLKLAKTWNLSAKFLTKVTFFC